MINIHKFYLIKEKLKIRYHGIDLSRVMIFEMANECDENRQNSLSWTQLKGSVFHALNLSALEFGKNNSILTTFGQQQRKDHKEVYDFVLKRLGTHASYNDLNHISTIKCIHPILIIKILICALFSLRKENIISLKAKFRIAIKAIYYGNTILELEKLNLSGIDKYLCMYNATQMENLITQFMKLKGISTYSLCEGIYVVEEDNPNIDTVNYRNLETDHLITWGQYVVDEFRDWGIDETKMTVGGYPHDVTIKKFNKFNSFKRCLVLLARNTYHEQNVKLLNILSLVVSEYKFCIKCHPVSDISYYTEYAALHDMEIISKDKTVNECLNNEEFDFAIAVNTSAYYEALMRGVPCLRYCDGTFRLMYGYDDVFDCIEKFYEILHNIKTAVSEDKFQENIDEMLAYTMGIGIDNYKKILIENIE